MYNFSILIGNDIAESFEEKLKVSSQLYMNNIEIAGGFDGRGLVELDGNQLESYRNLLIKYSKIITIYSASESILNLEHYKILFRKAHLLNIKNIKLDVKSYTPLIHKSINQTIEYYKEIVGMGSSYGIGVLLENQSDTPLAEDKQITNIFKSIKDDSLGLIFNPLEFVRLKKHPFFHVFYNSKLKNDIQFLRISDGLFVDGTETYPGEGNGEVKELASILLCRGSDITFSFVPYMKGMDLDTYAKVIELFKNMLMEM